MNFVLLSAFLFYTQRRAAYLTNNAKRAGTHIQNNFDFSGKKAFESVEVITIDWVKNKQFHQVFILEWYNSTKCKYEQYYTNDWQLLNSRITSITPDTTFTVDTLENVFVEE